MILFLAGLPRVGKDTFASIIKKSFPNVVSFAFAYPFKKALSEIFGWSLESFEEDNKDTIDPYWGISKRQAMEYIGTDIFRNDILYKYPTFKEKIQDQIWIKRVELFIEENKDKDVIITDLRHLSEYMYFKKYPKVYISRPNYPKLNKSKAYDLDKMSFNYTLENSIENNIEYFEMKSIELYKTLKEAQ